MESVRRLRPAAMAFSAAYSQVAIVPPGATTVYVGGQNAVDREGALVGGDDVAAQTRRVMANVAAALRAAGASMADLVSVTVLLVDGVDPREAYAAALEALDPAGDPPLVTAAIVTGLGVPGALVEVSAIAAIVR